MKSFSIFVRGLIYIIVVVVLFLAAGGAVIYYGLTTTTVFVVRHADKASDGNDPPLSQAGQTRAQALAHALEEARPAVAYRTQYQRTGQTVQPLHDRFGTPVVTINLDPQHIDDHVTAVVSAVLANHMGQRVLIVGHSNTVPSIIEALGGGAVGAIAEDEYDNLYVLTIQKLRILRLLGTPLKRVRLLRLKYGAAT